MLKNNASGDADYLRSLLGELKVMSYLGSHHNLVALVGAITENIKSGEVYLIFEYCSHGNAQKFVRSHRDSFVDLLAGPAPSSRFPMGRTKRYLCCDFCSGRPVIRKKLALSQFLFLFSCTCNCNYEIFQIYDSRLSVSLTTKILVKWAYEVACGMEYVSAKSVRIAL